jgi:hypothetical protein
MTSASGILWYHMHLEESRALHTLLFGELSHTWLCELMYTCDWWNLVTVVNIWIRWIVYIIWDVCILGELYETEFINHANSDFVDYFQLIMFNYDLWTNPQWSFGWPFSLSVWMSRRCAGLVCCFGELLEESSELPRLLLFRSLVCRMWLGCLYVWSLMTIYCFYDSVVKMRFYIWWCNMILRHGYLEMFY